MIAWLGLRLLLAISTISLKAPTIMKHVQQTSSSHSLGRANNPAENKLLLASSLELTMTGQAQHLSNKDHQGSINMHGPMAIWVLLAQQDRVLFGHHLPSKEVLHPMVLALAPSMAPQYYLGLGFQVPMGPQVPWVPLASIITALPLLPCTTLPDHRQ